MDKFLCNFGDSTYWLTADGVVVICGKWQDVKSGRPAYTVTPIKRGNRQFMPLQLAEAMEREGLFY